MNAVFLAAPYFLLRNAVDAMSASLTIAVISLALTSHDNSVISSAHFVRDFLELAGIMFGATAVLFFFGEADASLLWNFNPIICLHLS